MKPYILVVDDEPEIRRLVREILEDEGYTVGVAKDGASAREAVSGRTPSLILLDIWMPDVDGITLLKEFVEQHRLPCPVIMMSGHGTVEAAVEATRLGAYDFIEKPLSLSKLLMTVENALINAQNTAKQVTQHLKIIEPVEVIGKSVVTQDLIKKLDACTGHDDVTVLIHGEPGVGKAHCAKYIHTHSKRKSGPFIEFQTAAMSDNHNIELLLGKELTSGARAGLIEQASGGTLYIDDVAELNSDMQKALYGALISPAIVRVLGEEPVNVDVRIITATRYDLSQEVRAGRFREDLFHVINAYPLHIPPLREHVEDVTELLQYFVRRFADLEGIPYRNFSLPAQNRLRNYSWPGNMVALENLVHRLLIQGGPTSIELHEIEGVLQAESTSGHVVPGGDSPLPEFDLPLRQAREQFEKAYLQYHLNHADGSVGKVAKLAGMERTHLYRKLRSLGIDTKHLAQASKES